MSSVPEPSSIVTGLIGMALVGGFLLAKPASARRRSRNRDAARITIPNGVLPQTDEPWYNRRRP